LDVLVRRARTWLDFAADIHLPLSERSPQANERQYATDAGDDNRTSVQGPAYVLTLAAGYGMTYAVLTEILCRTSGAHLNPAITIASIVARRISPPLGLFYIAMQCIGGICGALMIKGMARAQNYGDLGKVSIATRFDSGEIFGIELVATSLVVLTWMTLADPRLFPYGQHRKPVGSPSYIGGVYFITVLLTVSSSLLCIDLLPLVRTFSSFGKKISLHRPNHTLRFDVCDVESSREATALLESCVVCQSHLSHSKLAPTPFSPSPKSQSRWDLSGLNPIRALGPAVVTGDFKNQWVFWLGPIMGGLLGMLLHEMLIFFNPHPQYEPRFFRKKIDSSHAA
jgi:glycerol uptake facilitator-like aquaporin